MFGIRRSFRCQPRWLVFLERQEQPGYSLVRMPPQEAATRLEFDSEELPPELSPVRETQREAILSLVERECWLLRHGENANDIAQALARFCAGSSAAEVQHTTTRENGLHFARTGRT